MKTLAVLIGAVFLSAVVWSTIPNVVDSLFGTESGDVTALFGGLFVPPLTHAFWSRRRIP